MGMLKQNAGCLWQLGLFFKSVQKLKSKIKADIDQKILKGQISRGFPHPGLEWEGMTIQ